MRRAAALFVLAVFAAPCLCQAGPLVELAQRWAGHGGGAAHAAGAVPPCHAAAARLPEPAADLAWASDGCCCPGDLHDRTAILAPSDAAPRASFPARWTDLATVRPADARRTPIDRAAHDPPDPPVTSIQVLRT